MSKQVKRFLAVLLSLAITATAVGGNGFSLNVHAQDEEQEVVAEVAESEPAVAEAEPVAVMSSPEAPSDEAPAPAPEEAPEAPAVEAPEKEAPASEEAPAPAEGASVNVPSESDDTTPANPEENNEEALVAAPEDATAPEAPAEEAAPSEEASAAVYATVSYVASEGGIVSRESETVDISSEYHIEGSTAIPSEGYIFSNWTVGEEKVSESATIVPSIVSGDITYTANFAPAPVVEEEPVVEEKIVKVTYKAAKGGKVSVSSEEVDINKEDAEFKGSTATPWSDKYTFTKWTDEDGNEVGTEALFVPADLEKDATFTAHFMAVEQMPALSVTNERHGDLIVTVEAEEGLFPDGTKIVISSVSDDRALSLAQEVKEDATGAKAVDIKFIYKGEEIQPADSKYVHVALKLVEAMDGDDFAVLHQHGDKVSEISDVDLSTKVSGEDELVTAASFEVNNFSVFIVVETEVPRLAVTFKNGATEIDTMYVKKADTAEEVATILYDPGAGNLADGQVFKGWTTEENYTASTPTLTIEDVRTAAMSKVAGLTDDDSITYYAVIFKHFTVTYVDQNGTALGTDVKEIPVTETSTSYTVNMGFITDDSHNFEGWIVSEGQSNIVGYPAGAQSETVDGEQRYYYENDSVITITGDILFSVTAPEGHWLIFNENGKGGTYNAPRFIKTGEVTSNEGLLDMIRNGYTFIDWYTGAPSELGADPTGEVFEFGNTIAETTTIYAKWQANSTANYVVLIWRQNVAGNGYDFVESVTVENAAVGSTPSAVNATTGVVQGGTYKGETGFTFKNTDQATKRVTPEGNTVVNVYYDRNMITFNFNIYDYTYTATTSNSGTQYGLVDGQYVQLTRSNGEWRYNGSVYSGTRYTRSNNRSWRLYKTMSGLYGSTLESNNYSWPNELDWYDGHNNSEGTGTRTTFLDAFLPASANTTVNFYSKANESGKHIYFLKQNPEKTGYTISDTVNTAATGFHLSDKYNGFKCVAWNNSNDTGSWHTVGELMNQSGQFYYDANPGQNGYQTASITNSGLYVYYDRLEYSILYYDGAYVDGDKNPLAEDNRGELHEANGITYGADITSYNKDGDNYFVPEAITGYVFEGWYLDDACTQAYTFSTMPQGGLTVYAKWRQVQYRVFLHPNAGTDTSLTWGSESQNMNFRVSYGGKISAPTGQRRGYEFFGWYTDEGCNKAFSAATVLNETTVTTPYDKTKHMTDPMDKNGNGATTNGDLDRFWITKEFNLYAKWSEITIGSRGIGIIYDAGEGTNPPSDNVLYVDGSSVSAGAAPTAPAKKVFDHWQLQSWDGTAFVDTDTSVLSGGTFIAKKSNSRITLAGTETVVAPENVEENKQYDYLIQLKAVYKDIEEKTPTHIDWYSNYGTENDGKGTLYHSYTDIKINEAVNIIAAPTRPGYVFKGWTKTKGGTSADFIVWTGSEYQSYETGNTATQVAADEKQPYEDLYAVWEEDEVTINYAVASDSTGYGTVSPASETVKVETGEATGSTATAASTSYVFDHWTVDNSEDSISEDTAFVPSKNADGFYEAHTYYAHFRLNEIDVTVHHYLKGTTTKVADDETEAVTIGSDYTATPVTKYMEKDLTVDSYNPSQQITVTEDDHEITIYYTLPLSITAKTDSKTYDGTALTGDYTIEGALDGDVDAIETALGDVPSITEVGEKNYLTAEDQAAISGIPGYYTVTFTEGTLTITALEVTVTITGANNTTDYDSEKHSVKGYEVSISDSKYTANDFTFTPAEGMTVEDGKPVAEGKDVDTYLMGLDKDQFKNNNKNFSVTFNVTDGFQKIDPIDVTVTITGANNTTTYDGQEHKVSGYTAAFSNDLYTESDFTFTPAEGMTVEDGKPVAARTEEGTTNMGLDKEQFANISDNFATVTFNVTDGYQTITPVDEVVVTITGRNNTTDYDGEEHSVSGYDVESSNPLYTAADFKFNAPESGMTLDENGEPTAVRTDAGKTEMGLKEGQFENISSNFSTVTFNVTDGYQEISPIAVTVTITGHNDTQDYDGEEHSVSGYDEAFSNSLYKKADFTFTPDEDVTMKDGEPVAARTDAGTTDMGLKDTQFANTNDNFSTVTFNVTDGFQKIDPIDVTVTITGKNDTSVYDGQEHKVVGYDAEYSTTLYTANDYTFEAPSDMVMTDGQPSAARTDVGQTDMGLHEDQFTNSSSNFKTVTFNVTDGYQKITPVEDEVVVTITGDNDTSDYDGEEHSVSGYGVEISNSLYTESDFTFTPDDKITMVGGKPSARRTDAGQTDMGLAKEQFANSSDNFTNVTFNVTDGFQKIDPIDVTVTITGANNTTVYDGEEHVVSGYEVGIVNPLYTESDFTFTPASDMTMVGGKPSAARTDVGTTDMGLASEQFENNNTNFATVTFDVTDGYQTITPVEDEVVVTITGNNATAEYDGKEHSISGYVVDNISNSLYTADNFTFNPPQGMTLTNGEPTAKRTDAGQTDMGLAATQFANSSDNFTNVTFNVTDGYQEITPISVSIEIVGASNEADYDGTEHSVNGYTVNASSTKFDPAKDLVFTPEADMDLVDGEVYARRTNQGTTYMGLKPGLFGLANENFVLEGNIEVTDGYQTIGKIDALVTILGNNLTETYNGKVHTAKDYTASTENQLLDLTTDLVFNGTALAERTEVGTQYMGLEADLFSISNENFENVRFEVTDGYVTVEPAKLIVEITGNNDTVTYDAKVHTVSGYKTQFKDTEEAGSSLLTDTPKDLYEERFITFTGNDVVENSMVGKWDMGLAASQFENTSENFDVEFKLIADGYLEILPVSYKLTAITDDTSRVYNGKTWTGSDFDYRLSGEKLATENGITRLVGGMVDFITSPFRPMTAGAASQYDPHRVTIDGVEFQVTGLDVDVNGKDVNSEGYPLNITGTAVIKDPNGNDVTELFGNKVETETGKLIITPAEVTVSVGKGYSKVSGAKDPTFKASVVADNSELTSEAKTTVTDYAIQRVSGEVVGKKYPVKVTGKEYQGNFHVNYVNGEILITGGGTTPTPPPTPTPVPTPTPAPPTVIAPAPAPLADAPAVLGARREPAVTDEPAVLGASRNVQTDDSINSFRRWIIILISAGLSISLILIGKRRREDEE